MLEESAEEKDHQMQNEDFIPEAEEMDDMMIHESHSQMNNAEYDEEYFMAEPIDLKELPVQTLNDDETVKVQPKVENQDLRDHRQDLHASVARDVVNPNLKPHTISNSMISKTNYELAK